MKTILKKTMLFGSLAAVIMLFSFTKPAGGDRVRVYFNGNLVLEQFMHIDKAVKDIELTPATENDKIEVYYSHCGMVGKNRYITIKDENDRSLHVWEFADAVNGNDAMGFTVKQVSAFLKGNENRFTISYSSKELPKGKLLATISLDNSAIAKK